MSEDAGNDPDDGAAGEASLIDRLDDAAATLETADTEADLDDVAEQLSAIETDLEATDLPVPEDENEDEDPADRLESRLSDLRDELAARRGPYLEDVVEEVESAAETVVDSEWTDAGKGSVAEATASFVATLEEVEAVTREETDGPAVEGASPDQVGTVLRDVATELDSHDLDPDEDAAAIAALTEAAEGLTDALDEAELWADLTVREQLDAQGFYDVLNPENRKDFPPEWNAIKLYESAGEVEPILTALDRFDSEFMQENALDALEHVAPVEAFEAVHSLAQRRNRQAVRILGRIGDDRACETLEGFLDGGDLKLELVTLRALGMIGSEESTEAVAARLAAGDDEIRSVAARSLGLIGDTRAIDPLAGVLADDPADEVRASAAWALNAIGTERATDVAAEYADDRSYIVQVEAERAAGV